ncbi:MAG: radical SAM protein [Candidatus Portnoybacteria bacterium]|nr:radical SAM protein [Candidatus Portnoybacteria bacterium]MDD4982868.1 radical SAM protein [Candidatus Portnoybacteria bacterium]
MTIDLCVWDRCNNKCLMCTNPDRPWPAWDGSFDYSFEAIIGRLEKNRKKIKAAESIYLTGGEPTLHPRFLDIFRYLAKTFPAQRIKLLTNGRRFIYRDFAEKFLAVTNNLEIDMSLCGPESAVHDGVTRAAGSFEQAAKGLRIILENRRPGQEIGVRTVLNKATFRHIGGTLRLLRDKFQDLDRVIVIFMEFEAQAIKNIDLVKINYAQARPYLDEAGPILKDFKDIRFYHFPLCTVAKNIWPYVWRTLPAKEVSFVRACGKCGYKKLCSGIHKGYLKSVGREDFFPVKEKIGMELSGDFYRPINNILPAGDVVIL